MLLLLFNQGSAGVGPVVDSYGAWIDAIQLYVPGAVAVQSYIPGAVAMQTYLQGAVAEEEKDSQP